MRVKVDGGKSHKLRRDLKLGAGGPDDNLIPNMHLVVMIVGHPRGDGFSTALRTLVDTYQTTSEPSCAPQLEENIYEQ